MNFLFHTCFTSSSSNDSFVLIFRIIFRKQSQMSAKLFTAHCLLYTKSGLMWFKSLFNDYAPIFQKASLKYIHGKCNDAQFEWLSNWCHKSSHGSVDDEQILHIYIYTRWRLLLLFFYSTHTLTTNSKTSLVIIKFSNKMPNNRCRTDPSHELSFKSLLILWTKSKNDST